MSAVSDRDEARQRREEARNRRRGQAPESPAEAKQPQDEPQATDGNGGHPTRDSLMSAATVAAAGAAVGAALGAARALTDRDDSAHEDASDREHREPEPEAEAKSESESESEPDETSELRAEPHAEAAPEPELEPTPEPREETPVAGATPDETAEVVRRAREQLRALHGSEPESISSLERTPRGWRATFEVVELERVPDSTDVLASYEVVLDEDRNVTRYARIRRYYRAQADHEERA